jgi:hypothetical protein
VNELNKLDKPQNAASDPKAVETADEDPGRENNYGCPPLKRCRGKDNILGSLVGYNDYYPYLNSAAWIDSDGQQRIKWTTKSTLASFLPVKDRNYFKNIVAQRTWECCKSEKPGSGYNYYLEPVYSKGTGGQQVILSMPITDPSSKRTWVATLDFRALSLLQTVLPTDLGYGYCVINNEGNVLFHSDESRNLLEDFFAETDNDSYLRSVILAREHKALNVQYQGAGHRLFVRPIPDTPWTLVTFQDKKLLRTVGLEVIASAIILFTLYALLLLIFFSLHYLRQSENRAALVWPHKRRAPNYYLSIVSNLLLALAFGLSIPICNHWIVLALAFILPALAFSFHLHNLKGGPRLERYREAVRKFVEQHTPLNYRIGYILALVTLFLLTSVLPMLACFKFSYDREMRLFVGLGQINLARSLEDRSDRVREQYAQFVSLPRLSGAPKDPKQIFLETRLNVDDSVASEKAGRPAWDVYSRFFFNTNFQVCDGNNKTGVCTKAYPKTENKFESLLAWLLPFNNAISLRIHGLTSSMPMSSDERSIWQQQNADSNGVINLSTNEKVDGDDDYEVLRVSSAAPLLGRKQSDAWWIGLGAILLLVPSLLYGLIGFIGKRIFLLNTEEPAALYGEELREEDVSQNALVVASSFTRKDQLLAKEKFDVLDLRNMEKKSWDDYNHPTDPVGEQKRIALNYFEYNREDPQTNREKVRLLDTLLIHNRKVVVVSTVDLTDFRFEEQGSAPANGNGTSVKGSSARLLSSFFRVYVEDKGDSQSFPNRIREQVKAWADKPKWERKRLARLIKVLRSECEARAYLQTIGESLLAEPDLASRTPEEIISHVRERANAYYHAIWETCSKDEKLTLGNLAKYHLVSSKNPDLLRLLKRGLISKDPHLRPMNESFSRFLLAEASPEKLEAWQQEGADSSWAMLRVPFFIILISAAAFLFVSQRDLYDSTLALVSAFAAGMPSLVRLFGVFQSGKVGGAGGQ